MTAKECGQASLGRDTVTRLNCLSSQEEHSLHSGGMCLFYGGDFLRDLRHSPVCQGTRKNSQEGDGLAD